VIVVDVTPVDTFLAVTSTPGINAPVESDTLPLRVALIPSCANPFAAKNTTQTNIAAVQTPLLISHPPSYIDSYDAGYLPMNRKSHRFWMKRPKIATNATYGAPNYGAKGSTKAGPELVGVVPADLDLITID
jgi:hypothetical protein